MNKRIKLNPKLLPKELTTNRLNGVAITVATFFYLVSALGAILMSQAAIPDLLIGGYVVVFALIATYVLLALKIAAQWEKAVVLRFGKYRGLFGPGLYWIVPFVDTIANWIDHR
ncbi:MAG TPA: SPFH domain-containing protein, partial [Anaerolineales bacterium]|nr:SPFH domain-containing protein [Anaerolineales bacterium]